jgi:hypothetical protein
MPVAIKYQAVRKSNTLKVRTRKLLSFIAIARCIWKYNIKVNHKIRGWEFVVCINLTTTGKCGALFCSINAETGIASGE